VTATRQDAAAWLPDAALAPSSGPLLLCLPYAGGGARIFHRWSSLIPGVQVAPVWLPGRERRIGEPAYDTMDDLVPALAAAIEPVLGRPYALFGHSMGAIVAFELARHLRRLGWPGPLGLLASASRAPHRRSPSPPIPDVAEFLRRLRSLGGMPADAWANPELLRLMLPVLRADFQLIDGYTYRREPPLRCPIAALAGREDPEATAAEMTCWRAQTTAFTLRTLPGGHFNITEEQAAVVQAVAEVLSGLDARP